MKIRCIGVYDFLQDIIKLYPIVSLFFYLKSIIVVTERIDSNRKVVKHEHSRILPCFHR